MDSNEEHTHQQLQQSSQTSVEKTALVPLHIRQVDFQGDEITVVLVEQQGQRQAYVLLRPLCTYLGLSWSSQLQRLREDEVLSEAMTSVLLSNTVDGHQQRYTMIALQLEFLPGWMFSFSPKRVRKDLQEKITRYRRDCYQVLWQAVVRGELFPADHSLVVEATPPVVAETQDPRLSALDEQIETLTAVVALMQEHKDALLQTGDHGHLTAIMAGQHELLTRSELISSQLDYVVNMLEVLVGHQGTSTQQVTQIDERTTHLSPEHAKYVHDMVDRIVLTVGRKAPGNPLNYARIYAQIYGRFKRYFNVARYDQVKDERFEEVTAWLQKELRQVMIGMAPDQEMLL